MIENAKTAGMSQKAAQQGAVAQADAKVKNATHLETVNTAVQKDTPIKLGAAHPATPAPGPEQAKFLAKESLLKRGENLLRDMDQFESQIGPVAGNWNKYIESRFGGGEAGFEKFSAALTRIYLDQKVATTGSAGGEKELKEIRNTVGDISQNPAVLRAKISGLLQETADDAEALKIGYPAPGQLPFSRFTDYNHFKSPDAWKKKYPGAKVGN